MLSFAKSVTSSWKVTLAVIIGFLVFAGAGGSQYEKLAHRSENAPVETWLPRDSESKDAVQKLKTLAASDRISGVIVFEAKGGGALAGDDRGQIDDFLSRLAAGQVEGSKALDRVIEVTLPSQAGGQAPTNPFLSKDGSTLFAPLVVKADTEPELTPTVDALREALEDEMPGTVRTYVTGEAGLNVDSVKTFEKLDTQLLGATAVLVLVLLLLIYRSPIIALVPLITVMMAYQGAVGLAYGLTQITDIEVNLQVTSLLAVLMFGAGTDYCLLLVARYRDELHQFERPRDAMREALTHTVVPILTSGLTVIVSMLMLLFATYTPNHDMGPVLAIGIACTILAGTLLLPSLLLLFGRKAFWPAVPKHDRGHEPQRKVWKSVGRFVDGRPLLALALPVLLLVVFALGNTTNLKTVGWGSVDGFTVTNDSLDGFRVLEDNFDAGSLAPNTVVVTAKSAADAEGAVNDAVRLLQERDDIARAEPAVSANDGTGRTISVNMEGDPFSDATSDHVPSIRKDLRAVAKEHNVELLLGGPSAQTYDTNHSNDRDNKVVIPLVLITIFLILVSLLRAVVAPLHMMASVVLSFFASLGLSLWLFDTVFDEPGRASGLALFVFIFVVALGVDYNIFLISRIKEETARLGSTRQGALAGLAATGGIITSAGLILAGTFSVLAVLPFLFMFQMGFAVAIGVLIDTFIVRSLIVPALMRLLDDANWWPGSRPEGPPPTVVREPERELASV